MDKGVPFQIPAKGMEYHDKAGSEIHGFVLFEEHMGDDAVYGMEKAVEQGAVMEEEATEVFVNGKDAVPVRNADYLERHAGSAFHSVLVAAGRAEAAVTAKGDKFELPAVRAAIHGAAERGITAVYHLFDVFHFTIAWMEGI